MLNELQARMLNQIDRIQALRRDLNYVSEQRERTKQDLVNVKSKLDAFDTDFFHAENQLTNALDDLSRLMKGGE